LFLVEKSTINILAIILNRKQMLLLISIQGDSFYYRLNKLIKTKYPKSTEKIDSYDTSRKVVGSIPCKVIA
jgi:hypothetical protein